MTPTEILKKEHDAIQVMLNILERVCDKLEMREQVNAEHLEQILEFFKVFADKCHHGKEEDLLFPAMEEAGIPKEEGPIGVMLVEHSEGRNCIKGMVEAVAEYKQNGKSVPSKFIQNARTYVELLTQHIDKENNILFEMADIHLSANKQEELLQEFEQFERDKIGVGIHEELHEILNDLKRVYF